MEKQENPLHHDAGHREFWMTEILPSLQQTDVREKIFLSMCALYLVAFLV